MDGLNKYICRLYSPVLGLQAVKVNKTRFRRQAVIETKAKKSLEGKFTLKIMLFLLLDWSGSPEEYC